MVEQNNEQFALFDNLQSLRSALAGIDLCYLRQDISRFNRLTLGQLQSAVADCPPEVHKGTSYLFVGLGGLTDAETGRAYARLAEQIRRYEEGEGSAPDWTPFFAAIKREELSQPVSDETSLYTLFELYWEAHTRQD
jgi:hypothetical protein